MLSNENPKQIKWKESYQTINVNQFEGAGMICGSDVRTGQLTPTVPQRKHLPAVGYLSSKTLPEVKLNNP